MEEKAAQKIRESGVASRCEVVNGAFDIILRIDSSHNTHVSDTVAGSIMTFDGVRTVEVLRDKDAILSWLTRENKASNS